MPNRARSGAPSILVTGMMPPAVEVMNTSCAARRRVTGKGATVTGTPISAPSSSALPPGDAFEHVAVRGEHPAARDREDVEAGALGDVAREVG